MHRNRVALYTLLALSITGGSSATAHDDRAKDPQRDADRLAIGDVARAMTQAFDNRDAAAIVAGWTEDGEFVHNDGEPLRGRRAIEKAYAEFFSTLKGNPKLDVQTDAVRFPSADMAVSEAALRLTSEAGEVVASGRQETVLVRESGRWKVALVREWDGDADDDVNLKQLEWLIGTWRAVSQDREVTITYDWDEHRTFIRGKSTVREGSRVTEAGTEMIGRDCARGVIRSWLFQSDGGFGGGVWARRQEQKWSIDVRGVRADGSELTGTIIYILVNPNTLTWQAVHQAIDGVPASDSPPIKVTKQDPAR